MTVRIRVEYLMEAALLGIFMVSACVFVVLLDYPSSPVRLAVPSPDLRRLLMVIAAFFRDESCGQCVPCRVGTVRQEEALARLQSGRTRGTVEDELALIAEIGEAMRDASICGLGQTASSAIESAIAKLGVFA